MLQRKSKCLGQGGWNMGVTFQISVTFNNWSVQVHRGKQVPPHTLTLNRALSQNTPRCEADDFPQNLHSPFCTATVMTKARIQLIELTRSVSRIEGIQEGTFQTPGWAVLPLLASFMFYCAPTCLRRFAPRTRQQAGFTVSAWSVRNSGSKPGMRRKHIFCLLPKHQLYQTVCIQVAAHGVIS